MFLHSVPTSGSDITLDLLCVSAALPWARSAIDRFSVAHHITGSAAWTALVMMALADVLTRLAMVYLRGRWLTTSATLAVAASVPAGVAA